MSAAAEAQRIRAILEPLGTPERAAGEKRYLKSDLEFLGVGVPAVRKAAKTWLRDRPGLGRAELVALVEELWRRRVNELRKFAIELLTLRSDLLRAGDMKLVEKTGSQSGSHGGRGGGQGGFGSSGFGQGGFGLGGTVISPRRCS